MKNKTRYSCPFCGSECKRTTVTYNPLVKDIMPNIEYVEYLCTNEDCRAVMSFENADCEFNPEITDRWFMNRYLGGDSDAK